MIFLLIIVILIILLINIARTLLSVKPVDSEGYLYKMKICHNYSRKIYTKVIDKLVSKFACSAFCVKDPDGNVLTARNYDLPHRGSDGNATGLNMVVNCAPKNGYRSVGIADVCWLKRVSKYYEKGGLSKLRFDRLLLLAAPFLCMDGINEKGFTVSVLYLDTKDGEDPVHQKEVGRPSVMMTVLMRLMLDSCATVEQARELALKYNLVHSAGMDLHIFLTDAGGNSAVFEWRHNYFTVIYTDISTNFYVGYDDAEDLYKKGKLVEKYERRDDLCGKYRFGYGHGFARFYKIADRLKENSVMNGDKAMQVLSEVAQEITESNTSLTQYSVIYNNTQKTMKICCERNYEESFSFKID